MGRLALPDVTLCAAASVNVSATVEALVASIEKVEFAQALLFTDAEIAEAHPELRVVPIERLASASEYSDFLLCRLADYVTTSHCLVVQWDGFVLDADQWLPEFLSYDYIGAAWPQFDDGHDVGNGGFSLRSRKLLDACLDPRFQRGHPEDVAIARVNRSFLEAEHAIRFADRGVAERFSFERTARSGPTFGFHGIFNMVPALGPDRFWDAYCSLDDRHSAFVDYGLLMRQLGDGAEPLARRGRLSVDLLRNMLA